MRKTYNSENKSKIGIESGSLFICVLPAIASLGYLVRGSIPHTHSIYLVYLRNNRWHQFLISPWTPSFVYGRMLPAVHKYSPTVQRIISILGKVIYHRFQDNAKVIVHDDMYTYAIPNGVHTHNSLTDHLHIWQGNASQSLDNANVKGQCHDEPLDSGDVYLCMPCNINTPIRTDALQYPRASLMRGDNVIFIVMQNDTNIFSPIMTLKCRVGYKLLMNQII